MIDWGALGSHGDIRAGSSCFQLLGVRAKVRVHSGSWVHGQLPRGSLLQKLKVGSLS